MPTVVGTELYNLEENGLDTNHFDVTDLVLLLQSKTVLMNWMQHADYESILPGIDRVIIHI